MAHALASSTAIPSTVAGIGKSMALEAREAGVAAATAACAALPVAPTFCFVFSTTGYDQEEMLAGVRSVVSEAALSGCSGEGVIAGECSDERDRVVTVLAIASSSLRFQVVQREDYGSSPEPCGRELAHSILADGGDDLVGVILFTDGLVGNCNRFLAALQDTLPARTTVVGGCAGDDMSFLATYQYSGSRVLRGSVCAVALRGRAEMRVAVSHGCVPIGLERVVTDASDGWLRTIDGQPAWSVFKEYLGEDAQDLNAEGIVLLCLGKPLSPEHARDYDPFIILTPIQLDVASGALFFPGGGLVTGERVRMTRRDPERIRKSAETCAQHLADARRPAFVLQFDCAGRGRILFGACVAEEIIRPLQQTLGSDVPWIGLHTYGEIAAVGDRLHYHNYTVALCAVFE